MRIRKYYIHELKSAPTGPYKSRRLFSDAAQPTDNAKCHELDIRIPIPYLTPKIECFALN